MSFMLKEYDDLIERIAIHSDRVFQSVGEAAQRLRDGGDLSNTTILRHDVDREPQAAVDMAAAEARRGIRSTYYFRCTSGKFPIHAIQRIADWGHETGYHYECLSACRGNRGTALTQFERNLGIFREFATCNTVAMHGAPLSPHNNLDLLREIDLAQFGLIGDAVHTFSALQLYYFTDTGGTWHSASHNNLRDRVGRSPGPAPHPFDEDFITWLKREKTPAYISTHPERWTSTKFQFAKAYSRDKAANAAKQVLRRIHGARQTSE